MISEVFQGIKIHMELRKLDDFATLGEGNLNHSYVIFRPTQSGLKKRTIVFVGGFIRKQVFKIYKFWHLAMIN